MKRNYDLIEVKSGELFFDIKESKEGDHNTKLSSEIKKLTGIIQKKLEWIDQSENNEYIWGKIPFECPMGISIKVKDKPLKEYIFPLEDNTCEDIIELAKRAKIAHFGHGAEVDLEKRKSWSISAKKVTLMNTDKNEYTIPDELLEMIRRTLVPLSSKVDTTFYKLLIYTKGDFFRGHVDSQYNERQFGTLMIQLPSIFSGGDLIIGDDPKSKNHVNLAPSDDDDDEYANKNFPYVAWLGNVSHAVEEIISGYRVCAIYQLFHDGCISPSCPVPTTIHNSQLIRLFRELAESDFPDPLPIGAVIFTRYDYSFSTLIQEGNFLHGKDAAVFQLLRSGVRLKVGALNVLMHQDYHEIMETLNNSPRDYLNCGYYFDGWCYLTQNLEDTDHRSYIDLYDDMEIPKNWKRATRLTKEDVLYFDISPNSRFRHMINDNCNDGRYGNWDCGPGFYYRETAILVKFPNREERTSRRNRLLALLVSYTENGNILYLLRTSYKDIFSKLLGLLK